MKLPERLFYLSKDKMQTSNLRERVTLCIGREANEVTVNAYNNSQNNKKKVIILFWIEKVAEKNEKTLDDRGLIKKLGVVFPLVFKFVLNNLCLDYEKVLFFRRFIKFKEEMCSQYGIRYFEAFKQYFMALYSPIVPFDLNACLMTRCFISPGNDNYFAKHYGDNVEEKEEEFQRIKKRRIEF